MNDLADRIEALTGPCREVDAAIMAINFDWRRRALSKGSPFRDLCWVDKSSGKWKTTARQGYEYTASIDAAMTLVPEGGFAEINTYENPDCFVWPGKGEECFQGTGATPAIALAAAAIRARAASQ